MGKREASSSSSSSDSDQEIKRRPKKEPSSSSASSEESDEWHKTNNNNNNNKNRKRQVKRVKKVVPLVRKSSPDSDKEEGEESSSDDSDVPPRPDYRDREEEFDDGFDEDLLGDDDDRKRLSNMTEAEREKILFERSEAREVLKTQFDIRKRMRKEQEKKVANGSSPSRLGRSRSMSPPFVDPMSQGSRTGRQKNMDIKKKDALAGLKEQREKKKQKQAAKLNADDVFSSSSSSEDEKRRADSSSSSSSSDDDSSGREEGASRRKKGKNKKVHSDGDDEKATENYQLTLQDILKCQITRRLAESVIYNPSFNNLLKNGFVRMGITVGKVTAYKVCQVDDTYEGRKVYKLGLSNTNRVLKCRHGKDTTDFRLEFVSNGLIQEDEFQAWMIAMAQDMMELPRKTQIELKIQELEDGSKSGFTNATIDAILAEKKKFGNVHTNYAIKKTELMKQKMDAESTGNHELVANIKDQLERCEEEAKRLDDKRAGEKIINLTYMNEMNRRKNINEAEKAIMKEAEQDNGGDDPWKRRSSRPTLAPPRKKGHHEPSPLAITQSALSSGTSTPVQVKSEPDNTTAFLTPMVTATTTGSSPHATIASLVPIMMATVTVKVEKDLSPDKKVIPIDLYDSHDFEIDLDLPESLEPINTKPTIPSFNRTPVTSHGPKKNSLNLEEYKRTRGHI